MRRTQVPSRLAGHYQADAHRFCISAIDLAGTQVSVLDRDVVTKQSRERPTSELFIDYIHCLESAANRINCPKEMSHLRMR
jgi:ferredoxin-like protein FixX